VTRLFSPGDIGERIKPFVFLDHFDFKPAGSALFPMHPHSGIATLTVLLRGALQYEDTTGARGELAAGSLEWLQAEAVSGTTRVRSGRIASRATSSGWLFRRPSKTVRRKANTCRRKRFRRPARLVLFSAVTPVPSAVFARRTESACCTFASQMASVGATGHRLATPWLGHTPTAGH